MYSASAEAIDLLSKNYHQIVRIEFDGTQETIELTEGDILERSFSINRASVSGDTIEIGSAIAAELKLKLDNRHGKFNDTTFEGAELHVTLGVKKWDARRWENAVIQWIPCGYFTVDEPPRTLNAISLTALDRMMKFDRDVGATEITFPISVENLINRCCSVCGVTLATGTLTGLPNLAYLVSELPETQDALTYRTLIRWAAGITGTCAYIDWDGKLRFGWYTQTGKILTAGDRYSSDLQENDVTLTGVVFTDPDDVQFIAGTSEYSLNITGNGLIQHDAQVVVNALYTARGGFTYRPYTAVVKPLPYLYPLDMITFVDKDGVQHSTIITNLTFTINGHTQIAGKGETTQIKGYSTPSGITTTQTAILERMKRAVDKRVTAREQAVLELNEIMSSALGLYRTILTDNTGAEHYYFHDKATLAASTVIYTLTSGGFAVTDDWNDGNPTWQYGLSRDGNAVVNTLSAYKITADMIGVDFQQALDNAYATHSELTTAISLSEQGISANIATTLQSYYTKTETDTAFTVSEQGIRQYVSQTYETISDGNALRQRITTAESKITDSAIISTVTATQNGVAAVESIISQNADEIRLQANSISWSAEHSSLTAAGKLKVRDAEILGTLVCKSSDEYLVVVPPQQSGVHYMDKDGNEVSAAEYAQLTEEEIIERGITEVYPVIWDGVSELIAGTDATVDPTKIIAANGRLYLLDDDQTGALRGTLRINNDRMVLAAGLDTPLVLQSVDYSPGTTIINEIQVDDTGVHFNLAPFNGGIHIDTYSGLTVPVYIVDYNGNQHTLQFYHGILVDYSVT